MVVKMIRKRSVWRARTRVASTPYERQQRLLVNLEGAAGSDRVVDHLEHRSAASEAEQMSRPGLRSALGATRDDLQPSATAGEPDLVVQRVLRGFWERRSLRPPRTRVLLSGM